MIGSRNGPLDSVVDNIEHDRFVVDRIRLVARSKIEDPPVAALVAATGPEHLPTLEPGDKYELVRYRNLERLAVHFGFGNDERIVESCCNRVSWIDSPHALALPRLAVG